MSQHFVEIAEAGKSGEDVRPAETTVVEGGAAIRRSPEWSESGLLLTSDGLARLLKISKRGLMRLRSAGKLPRPVQLGRLVRWRTAEIQEWVEAGCPDLATWEPPAAGSRAARVFRFRRAR